MAAESKHVVMVTGAVPGLGKSSLARHLASLLGEEGVAVDLFEEADIDTRAEFVEVIATFRTGGLPSTADLLDAAEAYAVTCRTSDAVVFVQDMLLPYLPSLLAWGYSDEEIRGLFADLSARCDGLVLVQVHLVGDPAGALARAAAREDPRWLDRLIQKVAGYQDTTSPVMDLPSLVRHLDAAQRRTMALLETAPWPTRLLNADMGEDHVAHGALRFVQALLEPGR